MTGLQQNKKFGVKFVAPSSIKKIIMLKRFFILCSGADKDLIYSCSNGEQNKYAGIGATVFFTAVMAFIASGYALFTVFDSVYPALLFGVVWGLLIFNLDRFIVSTIRKRDNFWGELIQASPRIILAMIIAVVISKPLEIKIFEKEINTVLLKEKNEMAIANKNQVTNYFKGDVTKNQSEIDSIKSNIKAKEKEVADLYQSYITEAEGSAGTKKMGKGPIYKEKREAHDLALKQLDSLKATSAKAITEKEARSKTLQADLDKKVADSKPIIDSFDGLMARINALGKLPWLPSFFIMLLFLAIETSPIIAKLLSPKGEYDFKMEDTETALRTHIEQNNYQRNLQKQTDASIYDKVYEDIRDDKEIYDYKRKAASELLKLQSDAYVEKQKGVM
ncbi:hypothetical protein FSS13T_09720 [Flavobacterium saliperosum S13]|uniref:DUF4407 domain-containing protein n=3 Tax=Flavobacterium saliperosum TaxID=329186 RepID=A0A1G4VYF7_9FLAO|nr:hypothetical protein FSS13T_09720 [Flavobacterium saliperosum S13]SCX13102.1 protein of unknown function [Flavobacterium saliperosum]